MPGHICQISWGNDSTQAIATFQCERCTTRGRIRRAEALAEWATDPHLCANMLGFPGVLRRHLASIPTNGPVGRWRLFAAAVLVTAVAPPASAQAASPAASPLDLFEAVWERVNSDFMDPDLNGVDWGAVRAKYQGQAAAAATREDVAVIINQMLTELRSSHTRLYLPSDPDYYYLLDVFNRGSFADQVRQIFPDGKVTLPTIGVLTRRIDGEPFVAGVLDGSPAYEAGFEVGDRIVSVDGEPFQPVESFRGKEDGEVVVRIQRTGDPNDLTDITVVPIVTRPRDAFLEAMRNSITIIERDTLWIGYVHIWSYAGRIFQQLLENSIAFGTLGRADALILDLREGLGGANPVYLNLFNRSVPLLTRIRRDGQRRQTDFQWRKPAVMLVNEGTRSGKEIMAFGFQAYDIGEVVGTRTAGAVSGGRA